MKNEKLKIKNMVRIIIIFSTFLIGSFLIFNSASYAANLSSSFVSSADYSSLNSTAGNGSLGYIKSGSAEVWNLAWRPDFKFGPIGLGFDVNLSAGQNKPVGYENLVLRYVEYDDGKRGLRYGVLDHVTWGHGLLLNNYSTRKTGPILLNNSQLGYLGYLDLDSYVVKAMATKTSLYAARAEERVHPMLTLGQTYITDTDGVTPVGTTSNQKVSAVGLDATVPLPLDIEWGTEYAQLLNHGSGWSSGLSWAKDFFVLKTFFGAAYRQFESGFVPGYYNVDYETNPINLASAEAAGVSKNGYLAQAGVDLMDMAKARFIYENYNDSNATVSGSLFAKLTDQISVTGYYEQPNFVDYRSLDLSQGAVMGGALYYKLNPFTTLVTHYKKAYNTSSGQVEESQYYEVKFSL